MTTMTFLGLACSAATITSYAVVLGPDRRAPVRRSAARPPDECTEIARTIVVFGPLEAASLSAWDELARRTAARGCRVLRLDLSASTVEDEAALDWLAELRDDLRRDGQQLVVVRASDDVKLAICSVGLGRLLYDVPG